MLNTTKVKLVSTLKEVATDLINSGMKGYEKPVPEMKDIVELSKR
jgi:hypothetical protein